jgi:serine/threonine protein kinase
LADNIPHAPDKASTLQAIAEEISAIMELRRKRWFVQIRETVDRIHAIGVVWGSGEPHNVLVDSDTDDAELVGFGRGSTDDLVGEIMEMMEGDELAIAKIAEFLDV